MDIIIVHVVSVSMTAFLMAGHLNNND